MNSLNEQNEEQDEQDDKNHDITINSSKTNNPSEELISIIEKSFVNSDGILSASDYLNRKFDDIKLSDSEIKSLKKEHLQKIILDKVLGAFKIGDVILAVKDWNKSVNDDITQKKRDILLATYFSKTDDIEDKINKLKCFITNIYGNTIFNTILKIIDEKPLDRELLFHLSNVLKNMSDEDFVRQFERQRYALALISQLTPQALTILADHKNWVNFECYGIITNGILSSDWLNAFVGPYCRAKKIDSEFYERIQNSVNELISKKYIQAIAIHDGKYQVKPTRMGQLILEYIV